ncbi:hypothetical protein ABW20_dc0100467 [Dactylellina cionopaga]|nr:hypothetical protein ABW20_dc0100467 [Dactylellina cionopaga]
MASSPPKKKQSPASKAYELMRKFPHKQQPESNVNDAFGSILKTSPRLRISKLHAASEPSTLMSHIISAPLPSRTTPSFNISNTMPPSDNSNDSSDHLQRLPPVRPAKPKVWGSGLFQSEIHIDMVNRISDILDLQNEENVWQPLDPLDLRCTLSALIGKLWHYCHIELDNPDEKDMLLLIGTAAFMRLGCTLPSKLNEYLTTTLSTPPLPRTITFTHRALEQLTQAFEIYHPGKFYIFETAPGLEMLPVLAETQNYERDMWGANLDDLLKIANDAREAADFKIEDVTDERESKASKALRMIASESGLTRSTSSSSSRYRYSNSDADINMSGTGFFDKDDNEGREEVGGIGSGKPTRAVSIIRTKAGTLSRKSSLRESDTAVSALTKIASNAGLKRQHSVKKIDEAEIRGVVKGFKNLFMGGGKKKENTGGPT